MVIAGLTEIAACEPSHPATIHRDRNAPSPRSEGYRKLSSEILSTELHIARSRRHFESRDPYGHAQRGLHVGTSGRFLGSRSRTSAEMGFHWASQGHGHLRDGSVI